MVFLAFVWIDSGLRLMVHAGFASGLAFELVFDI